jgi:hypothetical protein
MEFDINKVMFAGSDSIQRETYVGALMVKLKIQRSIVHQQKQDKITFFEGTGSRINRNGNIAWSRMGTILEEVRYERTIQGQQRQAWMNDCGYISETFQKLTESTRCNLAELEEAMLLLARVDREVSSQQRGLQKEPGFTDRHHKASVFELIRANSHNGSRTTMPKDLAKFRVKDMRAIMQSFLIDSSGFHPELLYWGSLSAQTLELLLGRLHNPIVQDLLNHYTCLLRVSDPESARLYIADPALLSQLEEGSAALRTILAAVRASDLPPEVQARLLIFWKDEDLLQQIFEASHLTPQEVTSRYQEFVAKRRTGQKELHSFLKSPLFARIGIGFSTRR